MIGKILSPIDASRFSISNVCDVVDVALEIVSGRNSSHCERVFVPLSGVRFVPGSEIRIKMISLHRLQRSSGLE